MALPKLLQKLFTNGGAGDKLNPDIIPVDSALSSTSENPVQNKVINSALDGKLSTSGGTVNGSIIFNGGDYSRIGRGTGVRDLEFAGSNNDGCFSFFPGENGSFASKKSASLFLTSTGYTGSTIGVGAFVLSAMNSTTGAKSLAGYPDGSLSWGGNEVVRVVSSGKSADGNQWYRKYNDGYIEQGGYYDNGSSGQYVPPGLGLALSITFLTPFSGVNYSITANSGATQGNLLDGTLGIFDQSATGVGIKFWGISADIKVRYLYWHACGY